ncbi:hypothetical protein HPB49_022991 [Dermacentor silvarum]|uniref:Uncharacterized protein n=1 Tax=Dermacentor silvarum TaxID=543639 RepID=A0ACB8E412_DERSI|nr:hypothetical protein HPB49_022991 [Dermacentor silvarum]
MQLQKKTLLKRAPPKKLLDYEARFTELHSKALALGLSPKELYELPSVKRLQRLGISPWLLARLLGQLAGFIRSAKPSYRCVRLLFALIVVGVVFQFWCYSLHSQKGWVSLFVERHKLESEPCVVDMPAKIQNGMMPPVDCDICKNLKKVSRRYAYTGTPVVVTDGASNWTALQSFSLSFFENVYQNSALKTSRNACQFFPYKTEFKSLEEVFNMSAERSRLPWYIGWSNCNPSVANVLRKHYQAPYFLPSHSEGSTLDWIFMGSPGYGAHMHHRHGVDKVVPGSARRVAACSSGVQSRFEVVVDSNLWYHKTEIVGNELSIAIGSEYD